MGKRGDKNTFPPTARNMTSALLESLVISPGTLVKWKKVCGKTGEGGGPERGKCVVGDGQGESQNGVVVAIFLDCAPVAPGARCCSERAFKENRKKTSEGTGAGRGARCAWWVKYQPVLVHAESG